MVPDLSTFDGLDTSAVSDALDRLGIVGQCAQIMPLDRSFRFCGPAFTVQYGPVGEDGGDVGDYIDEVSPGEVVVLDNRGRLDATVWGDILTATASRRGVAGTVIDGVCRDSDRSVELGYPVYSRGRWMRTGKDRVRVEQYGVPVSVGGVRVRSGDVLFGDADGVVVIPSERLDEVAGIAAGIVAAEDEIRRAVLAGSSLADARALVGYHTLQTKGRT